MKTADTLAQLCHGTENAKTVVAVGVFDGVHRGHRRILTHLVNLASHLNAFPAVLSFWPHPRTVLSPEGAPPLLTLRETKLDQFRKLGIQGTVHLPFTKELSQLPPDDFVRTCLTPDLVQLAAVCVGNDWRFGHRGTGNTTVLTELGEKYGFDVPTIPEYLYYGIPVSSTRIRDALTKGRIKHANRMLARPYSVTGRVLRGKGLGKRLLDCPTANIVPRNVLMPRPGVYAGMVTFPEQPQRDSCPASIYVGSAPTLPNACTSASSSPIVEVHLFDRNENLYNETIEVHFIDFIRPDRKFPSIQDLRRQIETDMQTIRNTLCSS